VQNGDTVEHVRIVDEEMPGRMVFAGGNSLCGSLRCGQKCAPERQGKNTPPFKGIYSEKGEMVAPVGCLLKKLFASRRPLSASVPFRSVGFLKVAALPRMRHFW
jgi:hypothetical protein